MECDVSNGSSAAREKRIPEKGANIRKRTRTPRSAQKVQLLVVDLACETVQGRVEVGTCLRRPQVHCWSVGRWCHWAEYKFVV